MKPRELTWTMASLITHWNPQSTHKVFPKCSTHIRGKFIPRIKQSTEKKFNRHARRLTRGEVVKKNATIKCNDNDIPVVCEILIIFRESLSLIAYPDCFTDSLLLPLPRFITTMNKQQLAKK